jgi:hypothetical protein
VGGNFVCQKNLLTSLEGGPEIVGANYWCHDNGLTSLKGAPRSAGGYFMCGGNNLECLENVPPDFKELLSDFGTFKRVEQIPKELRISAATRAERNAAVRAATVLQSDIKAAPRWKIKIAGGPY